MSRAENREDFGIWLRSTREEWRMTLPDLANQMGLNKGHVYRIEVGERGASVRAAEQIARVFNIPILDVFERAGIVSIKREEMLPEEYALLRSLFERGLIKINR